MNKYKKIILFLILAAAFALRFYRLDSYPALNADEASIAYDAYSLLRTGKDQHGNPWPIDFQSFNDYKPGLYVYAVLPFVKILGLTELSVRIPNALLGVATVLILYFLIKELFGEENERFAIISALFLAISPWHIHFSRGGWEVNTALFFLVTGTLLFQKGIKNHKFLPIAAIMFVLSMYCYQATRVVAPLIGLGLVLIHKKEIFSSPRPFTISGVVGFIILTPLLFDLTHGGILNRAAGVGLFADPGPLSRVEEQRGEHQNINSVLGKTLHNKLINYSLAFAKNWASHFHGEFLFLSGDQVTRNKVPETGQMYLTDTALIAIALISIFRKKISKNWQVILVWLVIGPIASSLTFQSPSALRAQNLVIPLITISAYGASKIRNKYLFAVLSLLVIWQFARYIQMYYVHMSKEYPYSSQYGVKELVNYVKKNENKYKKILITDRYDQPYILFLFYLKYPPEIFQKEHVLTNKDQFGLSTVNNFDKFYFSSIKYDQARVENPNTMIAGTSEEIPKEANIIKDIYGTNGFRYFRIVAN